LDKPNIRGIKFEKIRCIYCLEDFGSEDITDDHFFPKSWYLATDQSISSRKVPAFKNVIATSASWKENSEHISGFVLILTKSNLNQLQRRHVGL